MRPENVLISAIFLVTICEGWPNRYSRMRMLLSRPGGLGVPLLPPDKRYMKSDLYRELQRISSRPPFLAQDKPNSQESHSVPDKRRAIPLLPSDKKKRKLQSKSESPFLSRSLPMLPTDKGADSKFKSPNDVHLIPQYRKFGKLRQLPLLPPDKREFREESDLNSMQSRLDFLENDGFRSALKRRPVPLLPPDKKGRSETPFMKHGRIPQGLLSDKRRLARAGPDLQRSPAEDDMFTGEKDKAVVNLIESASVVLHSLAEKLKSYSSVDTPIGLDYDDDDLGKRVPLLPSQGGPQSISDFEESVVSALAEEEFGSSRPERSIGYGYKTFVPRRPMSHKVPILPYDKRSA